MAKRIQVEILGNSSGFERALARSSGRARGWGVDISRSVGKGALAAGAAIGGLAGVAVKSAINFESSFAGVRKTVSGSEKELDRLAGGFLNLSRRIPVNVNELNRIGEAAGQLGIKKKNILEFTETIAKLGVSSNLAGEEGAAMLARFANVTSLPQDQFDNLGSAIVALGNAGASTEAEIAAMALRIGAAGTQVGLTAPQILGLSNALSSVGIEAEAGGTAMSTALTRINNAVDAGGAKLAGFAQVSGMSAQQFAQQWWRAQWLPLNRALMYGGTGWGAWFKGNITAKARGDGYVVRYIAKDDDRTCSPCYEAERNGPYLPNDPRLPYPGEVCRGHGKCRCRHEVIYDMAIGGSRRSFSRRCWYGAMGSEIAYWFFCYISYTSATLS